MPTVEDYIRLRRIGSAMQEFAEMQKMHGKFIESQGNMLLNKAMGEDEDEDEKEEGMSRIDIILKQPRTETDRDLSSISEIDRLKDRKEFDGSYFQRSLLTY